MPRMPDIHMPEINPNKKIWIIGLTLVSLIAYFGILNPQIIKPMKEANQQFIANATVTQTLEAATQSDSTVLSDNFYVYAIGEYESIIQELLRSGQTCSFVPAGGTMSGAVDDVDELIEPGQPKLTIVQKSREGVKVLGGTATNIWKMEAEDKGMNFTLTIEGAACVDQ